MKVLFLDIDGVLNSRRSAHAFGGYPHSFEQDELNRFDQVAIGLVQRLCNETGCQIVLSSSWRYEFSVAQVAVGLNLPIIDATPTQGEHDYANRGAEIAAWLDAHPLVTHYAIVDDINAFLPDQQPHFVQTGDAYGLTLSDVAQLAMILTEDDMAVAQEPA